MNGQVGVEGREWKSCGTYSVFVFEIDGLGGQFGKFLHARHQAVLLVRAVELERTVLERQREIVGEIRKV